MAASINTKKKNIAGDFLKRTAGLITGAAGDYISEAMPVTTSTISEAGSTMSTASSVLSNTMQSVMPNIRQLKIQSGLRGVFNWFMQSEDDLNGLGDFDESSLDFDIDLDSDASDIGMAQITESEMSANKVSKAVIESSHHMVEGQMELTANVITSMDKQTAVISTGFDKTNETLSKILEVVTKNTATLIETTVASNAKTEDANANLVSGDRFSLSEYKKVIQQNAKNNPEVGMFSAILPMLTSPDTMKMMLTPDNIVSMVFSGIMDKKAPKLKENMKALDAAVNETIMTSLIRLGENQSWGFGGKLSRIFGLDSSRKDFAPSRSSLELKQIPFDTITKEAIVNTIPGYLRKILEVISGQDLIYDNRTRKFRSQAEIESEFQQQSASTGNLYRATDQVRNAFGTDRFGQMIYDLMMTDLGNRTANGEQRKLTESFQQDPSKFVDHIVEKVLRQNGVEATEDERKRIERIGQNIASRGTNNIAMDISNQIARNNVNRNKRMESYIRNADQYEVDLTGMKTTASTDIRTILDANGRKVDTQSEGAEIKGASGESETYEGIYYTNKALFEIFRVLNRGINVFKVGEDSIRTTPYEERGEDFLPRPRNYKPKTANKNAGGGAPNPNELMSTISGSDEPNLLQNQELENGEMEDLTKGERFARWGKARGSNLMHAMFSGNPEQVREAFGLMIRDVTQVAGDEVKKGASKINQQFGNVSGYLRHKLFGTGYSYQEMDPETGEMVTREVADNEKGGAFGFVKDYIKDMFKGTKEKAKNWFQSVAGYFDYGDSGDKEEQGVAAKRKKFLSVSVGAMAGAGILGGPLGVIMGAVAGNALSAANIGDKIKNLLFGRETEGKNKGKATGLITRTLDGIVDPIKFQIGKSVEHIGGILKKNILGPLSDIGLAIKDRITSAADSTFGKVFKFIGNMLMAPFKAVTKIAKLPITLIGNAIRGTSSVTGGVVGAGLSSIASSIAGKSQHTYKDENGEEHTVSTKEFLKQRRQERRKEVKEEQKNSQYRSYKEYKAAQNKRRAEWADRFKDYTGERIKTPEEIEAEKAAKAAAEEAAKIKENSDKQVEQGAQIAGDLHGLAQEGLTEGSIFTHDKGLHDRLDEIISFVKEWRTGKKVTTSESVSAETVKPANTEISSTTPSVTAATEPVTPPEKRSTITEEPIDTKLSVPAVVPTSVATTVKPANTEAPKISVEATVSEKESIGASKFAPTIGITGKLQTMFGQLMDMFSGSKFRKPSVTGNVAAGSGNDDIEDAIAEGSRKEEKENFGDTLLTAGTSAATIGGLTTNDQRLVGQMVSEGAKDDSNKGVMVAKFKEILQGQAEKESENGEKKESIWEKLFNLLGNSGILGSLLKLLGIGTLIGALWDWLKNHWPSASEQVQSNVEYAVENAKNVVDAETKKDALTYGVNTPLALVNARVKDQTDIFNPFTPIYRNETDAAGGDIVNYSLTDARNKMAVKWPLMNAFYNSKAFQGARSAELLDKGIAAEAAGKTGKAEAYLDRSIKADEAAIAGEHMGSQLFHGAMRNAAMVGVANLGSRALGNVVEWGAQKLGVDEDTARKAGNITTAVSGVGLTYSAAKTMITGQEGVASKIVDGIKGMFQFIAKKLKVDGKIGKFVGKIDTFFDDIFNKITGKIMEKATQLSEAIAARTGINIAATTLTMGINIAVGALSGMASGLCSVSHLFQITEGAGDGLMKLIAAAIYTAFGALEQVPGVGWIAIIFDLIDAIVEGVIGTGLKQALAQWIYEHASSNPEYLKEQQDKFIKSKDAYAEKFGSEMTISTWNDEVNSTSWMDRIWRGKVAVDENGSIDLDKTFTEGGERRKAGLSGVFLGDNTYVKDSEGNLVKTVDEYGNQKNVVQVDAYGNQVKEKEKLGDKIGKGWKSVKRWFTGGDVYETDENGNAVWDSETGDFKVADHQNNVIQRAGATLKDFGSKVGEGIKGVGEWFGNIGSSIKDGVGKAGKAVGEWAGKVGSSIKGGIADAGNSIKKLFGMVKNGDVKALIKSEPDKGTEDDPTSGFGKAVYNFGKIYAVVPTAIAGVGKAIGNFVSNTVNKIKNFGSIIVEERKIAEDAFNDKDSVGVTALFDVKDEDGNPASGFMKVVRIMSRLSIIPGKLIARVGKIIGDSVKKVVSKVSNAFRVLGSNHETLTATALSGNMEAYNAVEFQNNEDNPVGGFIKGIFTVDKIIGYPTAALAWVGKKIADAFVSIKNKVVNSVSVISANHESIHAAASAGDFEALNSFQFQNDPENPVGGFTEFLVGADRILHYPMTAMHWVGNKISSFVSGVAQKVTASVSTLSQNHQTLQEAANSGDFDALNSAEFENDPENPVGGITQFLFGADKILHYPITALHWVGNKVSGFITGVKDKVTHSFAVLSTNHEKLSAASSAGDFDALNSAQLENDPENPVGGITEFIFGADRILHYIPTSVHWVGKKVAAFIDGIKTKVANSASTLSSNHERLSTAASNGDLTLLNSLEMQEDPQNPVGGITRFIFGADKLIHYIPGTVHWIGKKISDAWSKLTAKISSNRQALDTATTNVKNAAEKGDLSGVWNTNASFQDGDPLKFIWSASFTITKLFQSVVALFHSIGSVITGAIDKIKGTLGGAINTFWNWLKGDSGSSGSGGPSKEDERAFDIQGMDAIGGPAEPDDLQSYATTTAQKTGGNPLNKQFKITSPFGPRWGTMHKGVDLVPTDGSGNAQISARYPGKVVSVTKNVPDSDTGHPYNGKNSAGNNVTIETDDGKMRVKMMHMKAGSIPSNIQAGTHINVGDKIGDMGTTGHSTGRHLHYQLERKNSSGGFDAFDPESDVKSQGGNPNTPLNYGTTSNESFTNDQSTSTIVDNTSSTTTEAQGPVGTLVAKLKELGTAFLSALTGGVFGNTSSGSTMNVSSDDGHITVTPTSDSGSTTIPASGTIQGEADMFRYLKSIGFNDIETSGILGAYTLESGASPKRLEWDYSNAFKQMFAGDYDKVSSDRATLDAFTQKLFNQYASQGKKINRDAYRYNGHLYPGVGYAQWTGSRGYKLFDFANRNNVKWYDSATQFSFMDEELKTTHKTARNKLAAAKSPYDAGVAWCTYYEGVPSYASSRGNQARKLYQKYGGGTGGPDIEDELNLDRMGEPEIEGGNPLSKRAKITSSFGPRPSMGGFHRGIDIIPEDGSKNADVTSQYSGTILSVKNDVPDSDTGHPYHGKNSTGNAVSIKTDDGNIVKNYHLRAGSIPSNIKPGAPVRPGQRIGSMGSTGHSTGEHLHYQIEKYDETGARSAINPIYKGAATAVQNSSTRRVGDPTTNGPDLQSFLQMIAQEIGITESPANSNNVKYNTWYYGHAVSGKDYPWCMAFVQWCFDHAGIPLPYKTAGCSALLSWYKSHQSERVSNSPRPGDVIIFNFGHTGIVEKVNGNGTITTIEGNTSSSDAGSQSNGGGVFRKVRNLSTVTAFIHAKDWGNMPLTISSDGTSSSTDYSSGTTVSTASSEDNSAFGKLRSTLSSVGNGFLNVLTGGLLNNSSTSSSASTDSSTSFGSSSYTSDNIGDTSNQGSQDANAAVVYRTLKSQKNLPDTNIAGVLGNWSTESGIDPTGVETIYSENYTYGPKKQAAMRDPEAFFHNTMKPAYAKSGISINESAYKGSDGKYYPGIGMAGYTGPAATALMAKAKSIGKNWWDLESNIAYATATDSTGYRPTFFQNWGTEPSAETAARNFSLKWEGNTSGIGLDKRISWANHYYKKMKEGWPGSGTSGSTDTGGDLKGGSSAYPKYQLSDSMKTNIAKMLAREMGGTDIVAARNNLSHLANLTEVQYKKQPTEAGLDSVLRSGWYGSNPYSPGSNWSDTARATGMQAINEILIQGKRTLPRYVTEYDMFPLDAAKEGTWNTGSKGQDRSSYVPHQTQIKQNPSRFKSPATYTFFKFMGKNSSGDVMGYYPRYKDAYQSDIPWTEGGRVGGPIDDIDEAIEQVALAEKIRDAEPKHMTQSTISYKSMTSVTDTEKQIKENETRIGGPDDVSDMDMSAIKIPDVVKPEPKIDIPKVSEGVGDPESSFRSTSNYKPAAPKTMPRIGAPDEAAGVTSSTPTTTVQQTVVKMPTPKTTDIPIEPVVNKTDLSGVIALMTSVLSELTKISGNTYTSNNLLGEISEKDFVDRGLRNSIAAMGNVRKKNLGIQGSQSSARSVSNMAKP